MLPRRCRELRKFRSAEETDPPVSSAILLRSIRSLLQMEGVCDDPVCLSEEPSRPSSSDGRYFNRSTAPVSALVAMEAYLAK